MSSAEPGSIVVDYEDGEKATIENVADAAEVTPGRLQVVFMDESSEFIEGSLFGGWGEWRVWLDPNYPGDVEQYTGENPLTMPGEYIRYRPENGSRERAARIKRLRRPNL